MDSTTAKQLVRRHCADLTEEQKAAVYARLRAQRGIRVGRKLLAEVRAALGYV
jgi:hypothetical protein